MTSKWAILVIWKTGETEYVKEGPPPGRVAVFRARSRARENADFLAEGISDEAQSVNVVAWPPE
jgi:hypothetical protein